MFGIFENPSIESIIQEKEGQIFDRKGARINRTSLVDLIVGFTNADGGVIAIGVEKDKTIAGVEDVSIKYSEIRKLATSLIIPPVSIDIKYLPCKNFKDENSNLLLIEVRQGNEVHANNKDEVFLRIGEENVKLNHDQRMLLLDDRGKTNFEQMEAKNANLDDLDEKILDEYRQSLEQPSIATEDLLLGRDLAYKKENRLIINMAGILLFGKNPEKWVERARIRFLRYEGIEEKTGENLNIIKDVSIYGSLPTQIRQAQQSLGGMLRQFTALDSSGRFLTSPEYPEFAWKEAITNAVVHRSYAIRGADIQIKMFDNKLEIISPGRFPGPVTENNISDTHYSRNARIARVTTELGFVRELGEGVNRIINLMKAANLPSPEFTEKASAEVKVTFKNNITQRNVSRLQENNTPLDKEVIRTLSGNERKIVNFIFEHGKITTKEGESLTGRHRITVIRDLGSLVKKGILDKVGKGPYTYYTLGIKLKTKPTDSRDKSNKQGKLFDK